MGTASFKRAVRWIADNDESASRDFEFMASMVSVCLVADLWGRDPRDVGRAVVKLRMIEDDGDWPDRPDSVKQREFRNQQKGQR